MTGLTENSLAAMPCNCACHHQAGITHMVLCCGQAVPEPLEGPALLEALAERLEQTEGESGVVADCDDCLAIAAAIRTVLSRQDVALQQQVKRLTSDLESNKAVQRMAYAAGYIQAECGLPHELAERADWVAEYQAVTADLETLRTAYVEMCDAAGAPATALATLQHGRRAGVCETGTEPPQEDPAP